MFSLFDFYVEIISMTIYLTIYLIPTITLETKKKQKALCSILQWLAFIKAFQKKKKISLSKLRNSNWPTIGKMLFNSSLDGLVITLI